MNTFYFYKIKQASSCEICGAVAIHCEGPLDSRGFVIDYAEISAAMAPILAQLDHQNIDEVLPCYTTAENLGAWIMDQLVAINPCRVDVYETAKTCVRVERT